MKISYKWLKEYYDTSYNVEEVSEYLTDIGLEVEKIERIGFSRRQFNEIVIGKIISIDKHPNADKLKITKVDVGNEILNIVCGAPNVKIDESVVVAKIGSTIHPMNHDSIVISKMKIRGIVSEGMLCSQYELGLGNDKDGIWLLKDSPKPGIEAYDYLELGLDHSFEIGLTPNRSDALGILGVARDLAACENFRKNTSLGIKWPKINNFQNELKVKDIDINIESDYCQRYCGVLISDINVEDSPQWLKSKLDSVGLKSINNVVDVTNFVMWELGTPLHAFDAASINERVVVKQSKSNTHFTTLDGVKRNLNGSELMITNGVDDLCIAGVMGGIDSGVSNNSTSIFIESALFDSVSIRKTAKYHGINSDSSFRFERGVDPNLTMYSLKRAASLIVDLTGGRISSNFIDVNKLDLKSKTIEINLINIFKKIGAEIEKNSIEKILKSLDIEIISKKEKSWIIEIPHYRHDVLRECDIIEEILRIYGYNNIDLPQKFNFSISKEKNFQKENIRSCISQKLVANGFYEVMNNSLSKNEYNQEIESVVKIMNPLSQELDSMRTTLKYGLLENANHNINRQSTNLKLFEFGKTYRTENSSYQEKEKLGLLITGCKKQENWIQKNESVDFYTMKGYVDAVFEALGIKNVNQTQSQFEHKLTYSFDKKSLGQITAISVDGKKNDGLKQKAFYASLDMQNLSELYEKNKIKSNELPKTFAIRRDFALLLNLDIMYSEIEKTILDLKIPHLIDLKLFDVYEGDKISEGKKSYAVAFYFQDKNETLKDAIIDKYMKKIETLLSTQFKAQLR